MTDAAALLGCIDHAVLRPEATRDEVRRACRMAMRLGVASVCVHPRWVEVAAWELRHSEVAVGTVAGFPLGATSTEAKAFEARLAVDQGADEVDMVLAIGVLKSGELDEVRRDVLAVVQATTCDVRRPALVKVILEMCYLSEEEQRLAAQLALEGGAHFLKTSTGLGPTGATVADVAWLRTLAPPEVGVKAAGGIRDLAQMQALLDAGASRIGTSATAAIARELVVLR